MAAYSQFFQSKRGRDEYWNDDGLAFPDTKRTNSRTLAHDSDLMSLLEKIDNMDNNDCNPDGVEALNELHSEFRFNAVIKSLEEEIGFKAQAHSNESTDETGGNDQMGSIKQGEWTEWNSEEAASLVCDIGDFKNYDAVGAELGFLVEHISPHEFGTMINYIDGDSMANTIYYSDTVHGYPEITGDFYESLWEDDIWQWNEHPIIQNDFASSQQEEIGFNGAEFHNVWNDF